MRHYARQDQHPAKLTANQQPHNSPEEAEQEANQHRVGRVGVNDRAVQRRTRVRHQFFRKAGKGRDDFRQNQAHALQDDEHARREGDRHDDGVDQVVLTAAEGGLHVIASGAHRHNQVDNHHGQGDGDRTVAQEAEVFRQVHLFGGARAFTDPAANPAGQHVAQRTEMTEGDLIVAGNTLHIALRNRREEGHNQAEDQRAGKDQPHPFKARYRQDHANHACHVEGVVPGQEDVLQAGKARDDNVRHHAEGHDQRGRGTVFFQRDRHNRFIVWNNALDIKSVLKHPA